MTKRKILYGYQIRGGRIGDRSGRAAVVQMLFALYSAGASYQDISDAVESAGRSIQLRNTALEQA